MQATALIITIAGAILVAYQDMNRRMIHLFSVLAMAAGTLWYSISNEDLWKIILMNIGFLVVVFLLLRIYFLIKKGMKEAFIDRYIGMGDILVMLALCVGYNTYNLMVMILLSCVTALLIWAGWNLLLKRMMIRIPLAGIIAAAHGVVLLMSFSYSYNPVETPFLYLLNPEL